MLIFIILVCLILLLLIFHIDKKTNSIENKTSEDIVASAAKKYVKDNLDYFNDVLKENIDYRITTKELVSNNYIIEDSKLNGYISINNSYEYINEGDLLIDRLLTNKDLYKDINNENMPFDINYYYKGDNNYVSYKGRMYRIIGITNSNHLKIVDIDKKEIDKWANGNINYLSDKNEDSSFETGIFYVGFVRSETTDIDQIMKNEKRNNNYTIVSPKYYGDVSYSNVSDIINTSNKCEFDRITNITYSNCDSYLLELLGGSYLSNTLENELVYYVNEDKKIEGKKIDKDIYIHEVRYANSIVKYSGGDGSIDNPYIID